MGEEKMYVSPIFEKGTKVWWFYFKDGFKYKSESHFPEEGLAFHSLYPPATKKMIETFPEKDPVLLPKTSKLRKKWGIKAEK